MVLTNDVTLPTEEELTVQEVNLSNSLLKGASFHLGKACLWENNEFMLCRKEIDDPRACLNEGKAVTSCALNFFRALKKSCADEFMQHVTCLDKSSPDRQFTPCRKTQAVFDKCMKDQLNIDRLPFDYYSRAHVHKTERPKPEPTPPAVYPDVPPYIPDNVPKPEAKYGSRFMFLW